MLPFPPPLLVAFVVACSLLRIAHGASLSYSFRVSYLTSHPLGLPQQVIAINGMFPGPQINATSNDIVDINVFNDLDEPFLLTWNGLEQRKDSWQDGVSGTNCPIPPSWNWTYHFQIKDQIGSFFYFPTTMFQKAAGAYGSIRVNNRATVPAPFLPPEDDYVLLFGDWFTGSHKELRTSLDNGQLLGIPSGVLMNGKASYNNSMGLPYEIFSVKPGCTYRFRISNVGIATSFNFRVASHKLLLVETEGSYVQQQEYDSLDVHVGQSYSFLLTANQTASDYYMVASPRSVDTTTYAAVVGIAILHYVGSTTTASGPLPQDPGTYDASFSINQARSIRWNLTAGAARVNPQGSFHQGKIPINDTFLLQGSATIINNKPRFAVNGISYLTPETPLKLADYYNVTGVFQLGSFPKRPLNSTASLQTSVIWGPYRGFTEFVFLNNETELQSWHIDGYASFVVGMGNLPWTENSRSSYNRWNAVVRTTVQVYPGMWTAVLTELDNVGMWNIRSEILQNWYLGQELYMKVYDPEVSLTTELALPANTLYCGKLSNLQKPQHAADQSSNALHPNFAWFIHGIIIPAIIFFLLQS